MGDFKKFKRFSFTLIEMVTVFAVFIILLTIVFRLYNITFRATAKSSGQMMIYQNARIAMDLIKRDLQCAYYNSGDVPFWHWKPNIKPASWGAYRNELIAFVATSGLLPNMNCISDFAEIKYQLYYSTNKTKSNNGWLRRSVTGDMTSTAVNNKWNFKYNSSAGYSTDIDGEIVSAFTANSSSSENYQKVIPYVTDLSFTCFDREGNAIEPDRNTSKDKNSGTPTDFPYSVEVTLKLLDKDSWNKWLDLFPDNDYPDNEPISAILFRQQNERKFKKNIFIGERG